MPTVHPTSLLEGEVTLADDVHVGPNCVLTGPIRLGPGCRLVGNVYLQGPLTMGAGNVVYPFACLGFAPQHVRYDPAEPGRGLTIGDGNTFREHVTIHRAYESERPTEIGDRNYFMANSHAGHDCRIGNDGTFVNNSMLAGHVEIGDRVIVGGGASVHQFCRIGRGVMMSGNMGTGKDIPPFFMLTGINICGSINLVGLRRSGQPRDVIDNVRWTYRVLYREDRTLASALTELRTRADRPMIAEYIEFIETSKRGMCPGAGQTARNAVFVESE